MHPHSAAATEELSTFSGRKKRARKPRILLGLSGSVAAIKVPILAKLLAEVADVQIITTDASRKMLSDKDLCALNVPVKGNEDEWHAWKEVGDPVLHIELRRWADCLIIAPLSANTLAKIAQGFCDNLLTCVVRAWDFGKPLLVAPAMNTFMWDSPFTSSHLGTLYELGATVIPPVSKTLACGDVGNGAMASPDVIAEAAISAASRYLAKQLVLLH
ncbi:g4927 [Coccomyxa elongata]